MIRKIVSPPTIGSFFISQYPSSRLDHYTPPTIYQIFYAFLNSPNKPNLDWTWFLWSTCFVTIIASGAQKKHTPQSQPILYIV